jgi:thiamine phosphate synthase YjbQ (UPF0047 family)
MGLEKIGKLLQISSASLSFKKSAEAAFVVELFRQKLLDVSVEIEKSIKEISFKEGIIKIKISDAAASAELSQYSQDLINAVNKKIGRELIKRVLYKIG